MRLKAEYVVMASIHSTLLTDGWITKYKEAGTFKEVLKL
jgi:hypothetical protein